MYIFKICAFFIEYAYTFCVYTPKMITQNCLNKQKTGYKRGVNGFFIAL